MNSQLNTVAEKLRFYREACALSQKQVAEALNIDRTTYTKYETGKSMPNLSIFGKIASIYNVSPLELLPSEGENNKETRRFRDISSADSPIYQLSKEERGLIAVFRTLDKKEKAQALELMGKMSKKDE